MSDDTDESLKFCMDFHTLFPLVNSEQTGTKQENNFLNTSIPIIDYR